MRNKPVLATISLLFLVISVYAGMLLITSDDTLDTRGTAASTPTLTIDSDAYSYPINTNFATTIEVDTANRPVDTLKLILKYDPTEIQALSISPQSLFENQQVIEQEINHKRGEINLTLKPGAGSPPDSIAGLAAIIVFKGLEAGTTNIGFDQKTRASIAPDNDQVITTFNPLSILLTDN